MKTNKLIHLQFFPKERDIFSGRVLARLYSRVIFYQFLLFRHWVVYRKRSFDLTLSLGVHASERAELTGRGLYYTYHINTMQNQKSTENQKNQQQNIFQLI